MAEENTEQAEREQTEIDALHRESLSERSKQVEVEADIKEAHLDSISCVSGATKTNGDKVVELETCNIPMASTHSLSLPNSASLSTISSALCGTAPARPHSCLGGGVCVQEHQQYSRGDSESECES